MPLTIMHEFVSPIADNASSDMLKPSDWNKKHVVVGSVPWQDIEGAPYAGGSNIMIGQYVTPTAIALNNNFTLLASVITNICEYVPANTTVVPVMTSDTAPSGIASANYDNANAFKAFDNNAGTEWYSYMNPYPITFQYQFAAGTKVTSYKIMCAQNHQFRNWLFQGSMDGSNWTTLDTRTDGVPVYSTFYTYAFTNDTAYTYYRFYVTLGWYTPQVSIGLMTAEFYISGTYLVLTPGVDYEITTEDSFGVNLFRIRRLKAGSAIMAVNYQVPTTP